MVQTHAAVDHSDKKNHNQIIQKRAKKIIVHIEYDTVAILVTSVGASIQVLVPCVIRTHALKRKLEWSQIYSVGMLTPKEMPEPLCRNNSRAWKSQFYSLKLGEWCPHRVNHSAKVP